MDVPVVVRVVERVLQKHYQPSDQHRCDAESLIRMAFSQVDGDRHQEDGGPIEFVVAGGARSRVVSLLFTFVERDVEQKHDGEEHY